MQTMKLPVKLTQDELVIRGNELAELVKEIAGLEDDKKEVASTFKARIEALEAKISKAAAVIRERREDRDVEVFDQKDLDTKRMNTVRADTGEIVQYRILESSELNLSLFPTAKEG